MKRTVIITGASGNLGKTCVQQFTKDGYNVIATVPPGEALGYEADVDLHEVDLLHEERVSEFVAGAASRYKTIDAALLLVGGYAPGDISQARGEQLRAMISLNFESAYYSARPIFLQMLGQEHGGRIVLVGARAALQPSMGKGSLAYSLSKSMLFNLAQFLNAEGQAKNIVTSVVVPGTMDTPANRAAMPDADFSKWVEPAKVAEVIAFITSPQAHPIADPVIKVYGNPE